MTQPTFYVSPEQQVKDRAEFARQGIARGRAVIVSRYADGILFIAENHSKSLHKVAEIYDRIGFAAVGRYNEFEMLRVAGIRHADLRGYAYDRRDVTGRMLANAYAQLLGAIFSSVMEKPYEVELVVAEAGHAPAGDEIYRIAFDGSIAEAADYAVIGGGSDEIAEKLAATYQASLPLLEVLTLCVEALAAPRGEDDPLDRTAIEAAVLDRTHAGARKFTRVNVAALLAAGASEPMSTEAPPAAEPTKPAPAGDVSGSATPVESPPNPEPADEVAHEQ